MKATECNILCNFQGNFTILVVVGIHKSCCRTACISNQHFRNTSDCHCCFSLKLLDATRPFWNSGGGLKTNLSLLGSYTAVKSSDEIHKLCIKKLGCHQKNHSSLEEQLQAVQTCYHDELFLKAVYFLFVVHQLFFFTSYKIALVDYSQPVTTHLTVSIAFCLHYLTVYFPSFIYTRSCNWAKTHNPVLINLSSQSRSFSLCFVHSGLKPKQNQTIFAAMF